MEQPSKLETFVNPIINVKMNTPLKHILEMMKKKSAYRVYNDDFKGIITLENILEEIVGDIEDEYN